MVLLYPYTLLLILLIALVILWVTKIVTYKRLAIVLIISIYFISTPLLANLGLLFLTSQIEYNKCSGKGSTAILLAGGLNYATKSENDWNALNAASVSRTIFLASQIEALKIKKVIISGGSGRAKKEADIMKNLLMSFTQAKGLSIEVDNTSKNTKEFANYMALKHSNSHISESYLLITDDWHMLRAKKLLKNSDISVCPLVSSNHYSPFSFPGWFVPQKSALVKFELVWHEIGGILFSSI